MDRAQDPVSEFFAKSELLSELDGRLQERFAEGTREIQISFGDVLLRQGDPITHVYGVVSGRVEATTITQDGRQLTLDSWGPGEFCGDIGVVDGVSSSVELRATENCRLILLNRSKFLELLYFSPEFNFRIFALIDAKLRARTEELTEAKLYRLNARLAKRLLDSSQSIDGAQGDGAEIKSEQADIAHRLGVSAETINRHLKKWEANGWLKTGRGRISLIDLDAIARVAGPIFASDKSKTETPAILEHFDRITTAPRSQEIPETGRQCFLVIEAEDYSHLLRADVKQTIEALNERITTIFKLVGNVGGQVLSHTGDVVLVGMPEASKAIDLATRIQERTATAERKKRGPLFRIGISEGAYLRQQGIVESDAIREATSVAAFARHGDVWITEAIASQLDADKHDLHMLGEFELKNLPKKIAVYSVLRVGDLSTIRVRLRSLLPQRHRSAWAVAAILMILSLTFWTGQKLYDPGGSDPNIPPKSLAIVPFTYEEGDDAAPYIADGIGRELGNRLSAVPELIVAGLSSSSYLSENRDDLQTIGRALRVAYVLTGHLAIKENSLRIDLGLHDTTDNNLAWNRVVTLDHSELVNFQRSAESDILGFLQIASAQDGSYGDFGGTTNPDAYRAYLNADFLSLSDPQAAVEMYLEALALDPDFAAPYAGLTFMAFEHGHDFDNRMPGSLLEMSRKAVALGPNSARSYVALSLAQYMDLEYSAARVSIKRALALNGRDPVALQQASTILAVTEDYDGYFDLVGRAWDLDPVDLNVGLRYAWSLEERNDIETAKRVVNELQRLYPDNVHLEILESTLAWQSGEYRRAYSIFLRDADGSDPHEYWRLMYDIIVGYVDPAAIPDNTAGFETRRLRFFQSRFDEALYLQEQRFAQNNNLGTGLGVASILALAGRFQESRDHFESLQQEFKNIDTLAFFQASARASPVHVRAAVIQVWVLSKLGRIADAGKLERRLLERIHWSIDSDARDRSLYLAEAQIHAIMGRKAEAVLSLRNALDGRFVRSVFLRRNPLFENLHTEPEFWALIAEVEATLAEIRQDIKELRAGLADQ